MATTGTSFAVSTAFAALLALSVPAATQDIDAFLDRFQAVMTEQGTSVQWAGIEEYTDFQSRPVIALSNVTVGVADETVTLPVVELIEVTEEGDGWRIGTLLVPSYSQQDGDDWIYLNNIEMHGVSIEAEGVENEYGGMLLYEGARLGDLTVNAKGMEVFRMEDLHVEVEMPEGDEPMRFSGAAESFTANLAAAEDAQARAVASAMGFEELAGYFEIEGEWHPASGRMNLSRYDITVEDAGTIGISLEIGGYTPEFIASLRETQARLMANPGGDDSAAGLAMLGLMQQLTFHSARIHFYDDTLTEKVLEFVAQQQGARARDIANQAKGMVPFMMMQLGNQELTMQATTAVSAFLDQPGSLVVAAQPPAPIPFALLMAGAMSAPQSLPQQLGVTIKANE
ncbi:MAG: hypothetical protein JJ913_15580 [Rhizobiaceae bacterium]|nr:hypothetical protein [Rhizobiaceae bacterium]